MKKSVFEISENIKIAKNTYKMRLSGDTDDITRPGQFINIELESFYLRRPISVCDKNENELTIIYKTVGRGTEYMAGLEVGGRLDVLSGLGNGFDVSLCGGKPLLIGGGAGVAPMFMLAKELVRLGKKPAAILGFGGAEEIFLERELRELGVEVYITTVDGSAGTKGFVTDSGALQANKAAYHYCCGPEAMMKAVYFALTGGGQYSFEERMGCGFGACMGCSCETKYGNKRICRDGPVLDKEEIKW